MNCPVCEHTEHSVVKTEPAPGTIRRRRQCLRCRHRWTTHEGMANLAEQLECLKRALAPVAEMLR